MEKIAFLPDLHAYDHDPRAVKLTANITAAFRPDRIIWLGDVLDAWWATTRFRRDPEILTGAARKERDIWDRIRPMFRARHVQVIPGNHDARLIEVQDREPELKGCEDLDIESVLCPSGEEYIGAGFVRLADGELTATHGVYVGANSAKREIARWGTSVVCGHDHTLAKYYQRDSVGVKVAVHAGHLAMNPPRYRRLNDPAPQTWMAGMVVGYVHGNQFHLQDIPFTHSYRAMLDGKVFSA